MRTSFHHQPEAQHPNFQLPTSWQADYSILGSDASDRPVCDAPGMSAMPPIPTELMRHKKPSRCANS